MKKIALFLICCSIMLALPAQASVELNDLEIAVRALSFTTNPPAGSLKVGIVYAPNVARSVAEAENLQKILGDGLQVCNLFLKPVMVKINEVDSADVGLFFLTEGVASAGYKLPVSNKNPIVCITTDIEQVINGVCMLGVKSRPKIEILVNRAAAVKSGTTFAPAFNMMITEI